MSVIPVALAHTAEARKIRGSEVEKCNDNNVLNDINDPNALSTGFLG